MPGAREHLPPIARRGFLAGLAGPPAPSRPAIRRDRFIAPSPPCSGCAQHR